MSTTQSALTTSTPARVLWFEIAGQDHATLAGYYGELFGWQILPAKPTYSMFTGEGGQPVGGIGTLANGGSWTTFYVQVDDVEAALARAVELGSAVLLPVTEDGPNRFCVVADPEGHPIGLVQHTPPAHATLPA